MQYLADSNIILRIVQPAHPMHPAATRSVENLLSQSYEICLFNQSLIEFWNAATRPVASNGLGFSTQHMQTELQQIKSIFTILPDDPAIYPEWEKLVIQHSVSGKQVHDTRIVAAMNVYGITHLLTFNDSDFKRFTNITVVHPSSVVIPSTGS
jgi:predicted nucleic acid-binding protein